MTEQEIQAVVASWQHPSNWYFVDVDELQQIGEDEYGPIWQEANADRILLQGHMQESRAKVLNHDIEAERKANVEKYAKLVEERGYIWDE